MKKRFTEEQIIGFLRKPISEYWPAVESVACTRFAGMAQCQNLSFPG
jgi:hypothetical protein